MDWLTDDHRSVLRRLLRNRSRGIPTIMRRWRDEHAQLFAARWMTKEEISILPEPAWSCDLTELGFVMCKMLEIDADDYCDAILFKLRWG